MALPAGSASGGLTGALAPQTGLTSYLSNRFLRGRATIVFDASRDEVAGLCHARPLIGWTVPFRISRVSRNLLAGNPAGPDHPCWFAVAVATVLVTAFSSPARSGPGILTRFAAASDFACANRAAHRRSSMSQSGRVRPRPERPVTSASRHRGDPATSAEQTLSLSIQRWPDCRRPAGAFLGPGSFPAELPVGTRHLAEWRPSGGQARGKPVLPARFLPAALLRREIPQSALAAPAVSPEPPWSGRNGWTGIQPGVARRRNAPGSELPESSTGEENHDHRQLARVPTSFRHHGISRNHGIFAARTPSRFPKGPGSPATPDLFFR